ncbi:MAG: M15 family metallopeptidase [Gammaproteobacteria bacterium]|nr:M15 family metallopeptidase [Gammaproteobacteria bacterium]NNF48335.1 M15 family metallopeptidase [Woeseiaceae bacterium]MBT8094317.1 M15 family metallopeptidase [Gammaproteobacteria bacterium]MBT8106010.1 M15 family metallopeptidase [Gammaproteobacteria bacterium]NNK26024.1 M15 family metallopeptidase [Woeseiaceae bacterium]
MADLHAELGIPEDYGAGGVRPRYEDATELVEVGPNIVGREQCLEPGTAAAWAGMQQAAAASGVTLLLVSGFRSCAYQARLIRKKINAGQSLDEILAVSAAPGFSEHHTGRAIDIATPGSRPLTEEFEKTAAFRWLVASAADHGFALSYPPGNAAGFAYEPWHWARNP